MKLRPKEILKNKSDKMIDLIIDEIETGGEKSITAGFSKNNLDYTITVQIAVNEKPTNIPEIPTSGEEDDF